MGRWNGRTGRSPPVSLAVTRLRRKVVVGFMGSGTGGSCGAKGPHPAGSKAAAGEQGRPEPAFFLAVGGGTREGRLTLPVEQVVGRDDRLDERVPHDVALVEEHEPDPLDGGEDSLRFAQTRGLALREVHLGDVAGDDRLGAETDPREK